MNSLHTTIDLESVAHQLERQGPEVTLRWAIATFGEQLAVATGFGPSGIVILHLVSQIDPGVNVFYLETDLLFGEIHALRAQLQERLGLKIEAVPSSLSLEEQATKHGESLWRRDPNLCCYLRKVEPLRRYLADKRAWVTGIRRDQAPSRATTQVVTWDAGNGLIKINPLAAWTSEQVWEYIQTHDLPFNPLHRLGFPSVGCWPCTRSVLSGEHLRAGRWDGFAKTECGLHLSGGNGDRLAQPACRAVGKT